jgi:predicted nucleic acid-binding protein
VILVDTSVWIDHFRKSDDELIAVLNSNQALAHSMVIGEIALGQLKRRDLVLGSLQDLPAAKMASDDEVLALIDNANLFGSGIGYIDAHLLASAMLSGAELWTRDKKLLGVARKLDLSRS